jgi:hypothetical protein
MTKPLRRLRQPPSRRRELFQLSQVDAGNKYVDSISAEDALINARLRNICRGC